MKVTLVKPPILGSFGRGGGFYYDRLKAALGERGDLEIAEKEFSFTLGSGPTQDILHYCYFDPFFLTLSPFKNGKIIVSLFDLAPIVLSKHYPAGFRGKLKWLIQSKLVHIADGIITLSENSKADIHRILGIPSEKIFVTPLAPGKEYRVVSDQGLLRAIRDKYKLPENFVLYVGDINYNKNIHRLLEAFETFRRKKPEYKLVFVGGAFMNPDLVEASEIREKVRILNITENVAFLGFVPSSDLAAIYSLARAYVFPSIYEGFGLTVIEAMACGCPVICGSNSSLREVGGDAAIYTDVEKPNSIADSIFNLTNLSPDRYKALLNKSVRRASNFSWAKTSQDTISAYKKTINQ